MKKTIILSITFFFLMTASFAQSSLRVGTLVEFSSAMVDDGDWVGSGSSDLQKYRTLGLSFSKAWNDKWELYSGIYSIEADHIMTPAPGLDIPERTEDFSMLSIPVLGSYSFLPFAFVTAGPVFDFSGSDNLDQSGIGYQVGVGGKYHVDKVRFSLIPNFKRHGVILYDSPSRKRNVMEFGLRFEVSYQIK
ncbi:hypothetical protein [Algoriphagus sp. PAP.12]|uniref:hypothetical protein n=1 Tax=Algoriphagus sp. PAP.12 TaxID=2996678 RepID=UPI00227C3458|nr:hypothetical protein [Algoriphagus sp. PAP.12]